MTSKKHYAHKARDASAPNGEADDPQQEPKQSAESQGAQEDVILLLAQQIQARREPSRYLEGWIRRFVRG